MRPERLIEHYQQLSFKYFENHSIVIKSLSPKVV